MFFFIIARALPPTRVGAIGPLGPVEPLKDGISKSNKGNCIQRSWKNAPRIPDQILPLAEGKGVCCMVASHNADPHSTSLRSVFLVQYDGIGMLFLSLFFSY